MSVTIKGDSPFDAYIVSRIKDCQTEHIKFHNISFNCETIEDADGRVFIRIAKREEGEWALHTYMPHNKYCPNCQKDSPYNKRWDFCPNCGADMRGEQE